MDPDTIARVAESQILEAIEEGKFANLPGKGQPLVFDDDLSIPLHVRMANKVLKNAGIVPEWVQFRRDILEERQAIRGLLTRLTAENRKRQDKLRSLALGSNHPYIVAYADWHGKSRGQYISMLKSVNTSILKFCMNAPSAVAGSEAFAPYRIDVEVARYDDLVPCLGDATGGTAAEASDEGALRASARSRYEASRRR